MRRLTILGTGCAMVTRCYNTCFAISEGDASMLVDAGGGNQILAQLESATIPVAQIHDVFVSHRHSDHVVGMIWVVRAVATLINKGAYEGDLRIRCSAEVEGVIRSLCYAVLQAKFTDHFGKRISFVRIGDGSRATIMGWAFTFFDLGSQKDEQFGFELVRHDGYRLTYLGDEPCRAQVEDYARGADLLLHEAYCLHRDADLYKPYEKSHATVKDAAANAARLGVGALLLYHTEDAYVGNRKELFEEEARKEYAGRILVPDDLEVIEF